MAGLLRPLVNENHYFRMSKNGRSGGIRTHDPFTPMRRSATVIPQDEYQKLTLKCGLQNTKILILW